MNRKAYLGDAVYVELDEFAAVVLTTEDGVSVTNRIVLEPEIYTRLVEFMSSITR